MLQIFQLTLLQVILERSSSEIHFRPGLKHQAEQMQHPANISRSIQDSSNKVEPTQNISTIDAYRRHFFPKGGHYRINRNFFLVLFTLISRKAKSPSMLTFSKKNCRSLYNTLNFKLLSTLLSLHAFTTLSEENKNSLQQSPQ